MSLTTQQAPTAPTTQEEPATISSWTAGRLVAEREIRTTVRGKGFWVTFGVFLVGIFASAILPNVFGGGPGKVAVVGSQAAQAVEHTKLDSTTVPNRSEAERQVRTENVDAAVLPSGSPDSPTGLTVIGLDSEPTDVVQQLSAAPTVDLLEPSAIPDGLRYLVSFAFGLVFFMFTISFGTAIAQSVLNEKQTRIVEILVSAIPVRALLAGKILGNSALVFGQVAVLAALTPVALRMGDQGALLGAMEDAIAWFVPFFILGFILLASMYAVAGSLVSRMEDLGSSSGVVQMLVMVPYFGVLIFHDDTTVMRILSYFPFSAPVAMPVRLFTEDAAAWEPFIALGLLLVAVIAAILLGTRLYTGSLLRTGGKVALGQAWARSD